MKIKRVCLLGGTGFVGRHIAYRLLKAGIDCRIPTRHLHRHRELEQPGAELVELDIFDQQALADQLYDCDAAINLVGILNEGGGSEHFERLHIDLTDTLVAACHDAGISRLLHMSALHADAGKGASKYLRSKGEGEKRAFARSKAGMAVTSFRPSVIFGVDDSFINRFSALIDLPGPLPLACPNARFAPVFIGDVTEAFVHSLNDPKTYGRSYELCGPEVFTLRQIVEYIAQLKGQTKQIIGLNDRLSQWQARLLEFVPGKPFTRDNYLSMRKPSVCTEDGLAQLGINATPMDVIVPQFLQGNTRRGQLMAIRQRAD